MDVQERFDPQSANRFFSDGRAMRVPVEGTVARGFLQEDVEFYRGVTTTGEPVALAPIEITMEVMRRGREQYNIFCSICHGVAGDGLGPIMTGNFGYVPAPTYHSDLMREAPDGQLFDAITNGVRTMPSYAPQIAVADRWAIVAYIRALQKSQGAREGDVPEGALEQVRGRGSTNTTASGN